MTKPPKYVCVMFNQSPHYNMEHEVSKLLQYLEKETGLLLLSALRTIKVEEIPNKENFTNVIEALKSFGMADLKGGKKVNETTEDNKKYDDPILDFDSWHVGVRWVDIKFPQLLTVQVAWMSPQ